MTDPQARPLAVQLYSLREEAAIDFASVLERVRDIGFVGVEPAGLHGLTPGQFRHLLDELGLVVPSVHAQLPVGAAAEAILDELEVIGTIRIVAGRGAQDFKTTNTIKAVAEEFNDAAVKAASRGMEIGYHNHWWELDHLVDGRLPYDVLRRELDPSIFLEIDTYWVQTAGHNPADVVAAAGSRARLLHIKDGPCAVGEPMTAAGRGAVDIPSVLRANASVEWHIVELDHCATDMLDAVRDSFDYLVGTGLSTGRGR